MLPGTDGLALCRWIRVALGAAGDHGHGARRGDGPARRPRGRRRRLPDEAVLAPRARGAREGRAPPRLPRRTACRSGSSSATSSIDAGRREASRNGEVLRLTALEFDLLWFLAEQPDRVFSRERADGARLGLHVRPRHRDGDRARPPAAGEDRGRPVAAAAARDGLGQRLPVHAVTEVAVFLALGTSRSASPPRCCCACCRPSASSSPGWRCSRSCSPSAASSPRAG